jgi:hypothetical protein
MSGLAHRNKNGRLAEHRTTAFLLDHFWVLKQSVDLDGAVFFVHQWWNSGIPQSLTAGTAKVVG